MATRCPHTDASQVPFHDQVTTFRPEEVASMMVKTFRSYLEASFASTAPNGCVVAVRVYLFLRCMRYHIHPGIA